MSYINQQFLLNKRPTGMPDDDCWRLNNESITPLKKNEILIQVKYLSIDPYMRGRMNDGVSYASPVKIGQPMPGETVGTVIESKSSLYKLGDNVCIHKGWQTYIKAKDTDLSIYKVPDLNIPLSAYLGVAGMPGRTAYFGLNRVGKPNKGDVVVVSAASGAVGSVVGQLAKIYGCEVIGIAGGQEKCSYVINELGFDNCVDYKDVDFQENLKSACNNGIDIYFENVGGYVSQAVASLLNNSARIPICGFISQYNEDNILESETPFKIFGQLKPKPSHRFFVVTEWMDEWENATNTLLKYILNNDIKYKETITKGFENAPQALRDVLTGKNFGKQLIEV
ncbi:NADP-dependent oxidoreductase [Gammaproteobacteria bacterium]|nr:NADP-dependent oxidoreductase [Gammaproteobacteria bacterium]